MRMYIVYIYGLYSIYVLIAGPKILMSLRKICILMTLFAFAVFILL